jgi:hypothetical protein
MWEYKYVVSENVDHKEEEIDSELNEWAKQGWELVTFTLRYNSYKPCFVFKRKK